MADVIQAIDFPMINTSDMSHDDPLAVQRTSLTVRDTVTGRGLSARSRLCVDKEVLSAGSENSLKILGVI